MRFRDILGLSSSLGPTAEENEQASRQRRQVEAVLVDAVEETARKTLGLSFTLHAEWEVLAR